MAIGENQIITDVPLNTRVEEGGSTEHTPFAVASARAASSKPAISAGRAATWLFEPFRHRTFLFRI